MQGYKTSYIVTKDEMLFLLSGTAGMKLTASTKSIVERYLNGAAITHEAVESLVYKKLARKDAGKVVLEPVVDLIVKAILGSQKIWNSGDAEDGRTDLVVQAKALFLHIQDYPLAEGTWKITPYQNMEKLKNNVKWLKNEAGQGGKT